MTVPDQPVAGESAPRHPWLAALLSLLLPGLGHVYSGALRRVVGVPGDTLAMQSGELIVNGEPLQEPYARRAPSDVHVKEFAWQRGYVLPGVDPALYEASLMNWGPILLPADKYFVLGDNRGESVDSRYLGFVSERDLFERPTVIYFSRGDSGEVRWDRIGHSPQ